MVTPKWMRRAALRREYCDLNMYQIAKDICLNVDHAAIARRAYLQQHGKHHSTNLNDFDYLNMKMKHLWQRTAKGRGSLRPPKAKVIKIDHVGVGGRAAPHYGVVSGSDVVTLVHEMVHYTHLSAFEASWSETGSRRRPHDEMYNRIFLLTFKAWLDLAKNKKRLPRMPWGMTSPRRMGWSKGRGYAPTDRMHAWWNKRMIHPFGFKGFAA